MKKTFILALGFLVGRVIAQDNSFLTNHNQKINYAFGLDIVSTLKQQGVEVDMKAFTAGMEDALAGKAVLRPEQRKAAMQALEESLQSKAELNRKADAIRNLKDGQSFLAANGKKEGVKVKEILAPNGEKAELQYKVLKSGSGPSPILSDTVELHYTGALIDGTVFDSSVKRGASATFRVADGIPGWTEALKMMNVGDKWQVFLPPSLTFGERGAAGIGPNSTLIFEIELLRICSPREADPASGTHLLPTAGK